MHIRRAKEEIRNTIQAYLMKDEFGQYAIPVVSQRPILLTGPPGVGKTAIMEQVARECGVGLVSYSLAHHTSQSAMELPFMKHKIYDDKECVVAQYTMSEILASVYERMEQTGLKEGILFLDEFNCIFEAMVPVILQFLQSKIWGNWKLPEGWMIVAAESRAENDKSVRDFDTVMRDRVRLIEVSADYGIWREYAYHQNIHNSILAYLEIKKENFYENKFVTARGWEDLSRILYSYEKLGIAVDEELVMQYLQHAEIAKDFAGYYHLYKRYSREYSIEGLLAGTVSQDVLEKVWQADYDERLSVLCLILGRLNERFLQIMERDSYVSDLYETLIDYREQLDASQEQLTASNPGVLLSRKEAIKLLSRHSKRYSKELKDKKEAGLLNRMEERCMRRVLAELENEEHLLMTTDCENASEAFAMMKAGFNRETAGLEEENEQISLILENAFDFVEKAFGEGQEMAVFITELSSSYYAIRFISDNGCARYYHYNRLLLSGEQEEMFRQRRSEGESIHNIEEE